MHCKKMIIPYKAKFSMTALFIFWISLYFCCCRVFAGTDPNPAEVYNLELRVMSFNIRYGTADDGENNWKNRREMLFELLRVHRCDVIGLQEALKFQIDDIMEAVPQFAMVGVGRDDGKTKGEYNAILYDLERFSVDESGTFWLSDTPEVPGSITWGNACTRICTWARFLEKESGRAFYVYNMHLDHVSQPSREKSVVLVAERIDLRKYKDPYIITGDFNVGENNPAVLFLQGKHAFDNGLDGETTNPFKVVDTFRILHPDAKEVGTFNQFRGIRTGDKIDYIFTTPDVKVLEAAIIRDNTDGRFPSDHFPVTARLRLVSTP